MYVDRKPEGALFVLRHSAGESAATKPVASDVAASDRPEPWALRAALKETGLQYYQMDSTRLYGRGYWSADPEAHVLS